MAKGSDNEFPKIILDEQASTPSTPPAGMQKLFVDSSDHKLKRVDENDVVTEIEGALDIDALDEKATPVSGDMFVVADSEDGGALKKVDLDNLPTGGGSGGLAWTQVVDESGASFANFAGGSGTWASDGTVIKQTNTGASAAYARYNTMLITNLIVFEAEIQLRSSGADRIGGLVVGFDGSNAAGLGVRLNEGSDEIQSEVVFTTNKLAVAQTINVNTWYKLRLVVSGGRVTFYLDDVIKGSSNINPTITNASYIGFYTYQAEVWYRNIKAWNLELPS